MESIFGVWLHDKRQRYEVKKIGSQEFRFFGEKNLHRNIQCDSITSTLSMWMTMIGRKRSGNETGNDGQPAERICKAV
jgi:hypothetical protein